MRKTILFNIFIMILIMGLVLVSCNKKEEKATHQGHGDSAPRSSEKKVDRAAGLNEGKVKIGTEQGYYSLNAEFMTKPVKVGRNAMKLTIFDKESKEPEENLELEVVPWMPMHEHAGIGTPIVKERGNGQYQVDNINFTMLGDWEVYIKIKKGRSEDTAVFNVSVMSEDR